MRKILSRRVLFLRPVSVAFGVAVVGVVALSLAGCAEQAGTGTNVPIPIVEISCTTNRCKALNPGRAFIVYTTSSCANAAFGETVAGSTTLVCNGLGCSGSVTNFTAGSGVSTNTMRDGFYSICVVIDFNSNYIGAAMAGEDSTGSLANTNVVSGVTTRSVTSFTDI